MAEQLALAMTSNIIRLFVSSTFADFQVERNVLQERVFPTLRQVCAQSGYRLQPIDLRWGVSEEAGTARQTLRICFDELVRCRQISPDCFLLILLGNRYGSHILPPAIPRDVGERLLPHLAPGEGRAFDANYRLDENGVPPEYVLLRAEGPERTEDESLRQALVRAAKLADLSKDDRLPFEASATHREIQLGLLGQPAGAGHDAGVLCAVRFLMGEPQGPEAEHFVERDTERATHVQRLRKAILDRLPAGQVRKYEVRWDGERGPAFDHHALAAAYLDLLRPKLEEVIAARTAAREAAAAEGHDGAARANAVFEAERLEYFVGREQPLAAIAAYLDAPATVPLLVAGAGGTGKSTLLARVVERARAAYPSALLLARYIGVTPGAESLRTLLEGLRIELAQAYGQESPQVREDYERAEAFRAALGWATAARPLILVLDALDQLGPPPLTLDWVPETLPPHVHLVSSLLDEPDRPEFSMLLARTLAPLVVPLGKMDATEGDALLERWLSESGRTLQSPQHAAALDAFAHEGRPLYLRLVFEEARRWRSFDDLVDLSPRDPTIPGLLRARFARLEQPDEHGLVLTGHTLGLLRAAKNGLAEDEILAVLARDDAVRAEQHALAPSSPDIDPTLPLPVALWARLYADLAPYLTERDADGTRLFTFYHRQLAQVADERYLQAPDGAILHRELATLFEAQLSTDGNQPNLRKLSEQAFQEATGGLTAELERTLTDLGLLEQKIAYQGTIGALDDLGLALVSDVTLAQVADAVRLGAYVLDKSPNQVENQLRGRLPKETFVRLHDAPPRGLPHLRLDSPSLTPVGGALSRTLAGHLGEVNVCAFSPNGRLVISASVDSTLRLWDVARGELAHVLIGHSREVEACVFSPSGRLVLSGSIDNTLRLWDVESGRTVHVLEGHSSAVEGCAFSPDGHLVLSASLDGTLRLWDTGSGEAVRTLRGHTAEVWDCAFSPDGRLALSAGGYDDNTVRLWDVETGQIVHVLEGHTDGVRTCAFSPNGRLALSGSHDFTLRLWDVKTGQIVHELDGYSNACAFSPDGRMILSGSADQNSLILWNVASGQVVHVLKGHTDSVEACAFSPDGRSVLSASEDETLRLWDVDSGEALQVLEGHSGAVNVCMFNPDGRLILSAGEDLTLRLWNVTSSQKQRAQVGHVDAVTACSFGPDSRLAVSSSADRTLRVWETDSGETLRTLEGHSDEVWDCAFSPDGRSVLSASWDKTLRLWDVITGQTIYVLEGHTGHVRKCAYSPDGRVVASASDDATVRIWDVATGQTIHVLKGHADPVTNVAFSPDGQLILSASVDLTLRLWSVVSGQTEHVFEGHNKGTSDDLYYGISDCAFSPDGSLAVSASYDRTLRLWDVSNGHTVHVLAGHTEAVGSCAFSPDGRLVVSSAADGSVRLWDVASGQTAHVLDGQSAEDCVFSPDGRLVLSASDDATLSLWDVATGHELSRFYADAPLWNCALSQRGGRALAGGYDGAIHFITVLGTMDQPESLKDSSTTGAESHTSITPDSAEILPSRPEMGLAFKPKDPVRPERGKGKHWWWPFR